jgi:AAA domain
MGSHLPEIEIAFPDATEPPLTTRERLLLAAQLPSETGKLEVVTVEPFVGRSHAEVLKMHFEGERFLVADLLGPASVSTIAGVPETHKSWLAQQIAVGVASGEGDVFGREVVSGGPVGYFWQDDSEREEAERVQLYERAHPSSPELPLTWFLNKGVCLPDDLGRLRLTVETHGFVLAILDSFYNFAPGVELATEEASAIVARLKAEVCDTTGCHVLVVDHMPWATEQNRKRLRGYGGVFKGAATRSGIYIDADGTKLSVEIRGNNITSLKRTPAYWDADTLSLRLVDQHDVDTEEKKRKLVSWITANPGKATNKVSAGAGGNEKTNTKLLNELAEERRITKCSAKDVGAAKAGNYWMPCTDAGSCSASDLSAAERTTSDGVSQAACSASSASPYRGRRSGGAEQDTAEEPAEHSSLPGDVTFPDFIDNCFQHGHLAIGEWLERRKQHALLSKAEAA